MGIRAAAPAFLTTMSMYSMVLRLRIQFVFAHSILYLPLIQGQSNQSICLVCHEQWNVQHVTIQFQVIQGEPDAELHLIREAVPEHLQTRFLLPIFSNRG